VTHSSLPSASRIIKCPQTCGASVAPVVLLKISAVFSVFLKC
jgi:hypothetical protein